MTKCNSYFIHIQLNLLITSIQLYFSRFLEHQILDIKSTESSFLPDYKEITNNSNVKTSLENSKLIKQNEELSNINLLLKSELDKLQKQVELMEKKQVSF